ncbi:two component transcriptional regulator, LytTR family [Sporobacter termitidis DSM 10068]|uniref:Stage 0 sporulation protein A homolog n=1 Tax=Sporobacter termitidis DSM 10068 TaxID=1123282 RepID=A0A1M5Z739_9FIRM|nr:LytTR family DNA-binding domain-containing protein [Sporobacter termitidis]SHI20049.1 two component transcriptional regulator, LytTR family [Sporobacter termitidis DSM 10068]
MYRVAICDDEMTICAQVERMIMDYGKSISEEMEIDVYCSGEELCKFLRSGAEYDILFLDIEFKQLNGVEIGEKIRNELGNETMQIVYISGNQSYAIELFNIRPLNFLIKPLESDKVINVLKKGMELSAKKCKYFTYKQGHVTKKKLIEDILYFESINRQVKMTASAEAVVFYGSLSAIFSQLQACRFFYIHKSYLINYNHVIEFSYDHLVMSDKTVLPISQSKRKEVRDLQIKIEKER